MLYQKIIIVIVVCGPNFQLNASFKNINL